MRARSLDPLVAAALTLAAGWGMMNLWWIRTQSTQLRGLYDYWSSTLGDGIVLPVMAYSLTRLGQLLPPRHTRRGTLTGAVIGAIAGGAITISWLADSDPTPNWTLPYPGHFTAAGWYHAAFMIAALITFTAMFLDLITRLQTSITRRSEVHRHFVVVLAAFASFGALLLIDNRPTGSFSSAVTVAGASALLGIALTGLWLAGENPGRGRRGRSQSHN